MKNGIYVATETVYQRVPGVQAIASGQVRPIHLLLVVRGDFGGGGSEHHELEEPVKGGGGERGDGGTGTDIRSHPQPDGQAVAPQDLEKEAHRRQGRRVVPLRRQERRPPRLGS